MTVKTEKFQIGTKGNTDILDITEKVAEKVRNSGLINGIATVINPGSTAGITTIENEGRLLSDFKEILEKIVPTNAKYRHPGNAFAHIGSVLVGASFTVPFRDKRLILGTWQQIVLIDFDNHPRTREIIVQISGE